MPNINLFGLRSGRQIKEDGSIVNLANKIDELHKALVIDKNAGVSLTGSNAQIDGATAPPIQLMSFNGSTWDRWRNNTKGILLASATRTSSTSSGNQPNYNAKGLALYLDVTANPGGSETLSIVLGFNDPASGKGIWVATISNLFQATNGTKVVLFYPGVPDTTGSILTTKNLVIPKDWYVIVSHSGSGSWTYSLGYSLIL